MNRNRVSDLKDAVSIDRVLLHYGWDGQTFGYGVSPKIRCPFHDDNEPSASMYTESGYFKCYACDAKGDIIDLVRENENLGFMGAVEFLERRF